MVNKMTISIQMDNDAFQADKWREVSRILKDIANRVIVDDMPYSLVDINGNSVGTVVYE